MLILYQHSRIPDKYPIQHLAFPQNSYTMFKKGTGDHDAL